jgi:hypothetical protein
VVTAVLRSVDAATARDVAAAFEAAPSEDRTARTRAAYDRLALEARASFARWTATGRPRARVVFTRCAEPYADVAELARSVRADRLLEIHSAGFDRERQHPVLDSSVGGTFDQLRAVHDLVSHAWCGLPFDRDGEYSAWRAEESLYSPIAAWALATELHAQHSVLWTTGQLAPLKATLLPGELLRAARRARPAPGPRPTRSPR